MASKLRCVVYGLLAITGLVLPWYFNWQFMQTMPGGSFSLKAFVAGGYANPAAASLTTDLSIAGMAGVIWMFAEAKRLQMRFIWLYFVLTFMVAFAFAFPLFLLVREVTLDAQKTQAPTST